MTPMFPQPDGQPKVSLTIRPSRWIVGFRMTQLLSLVISLGLTIPALLHAMKYDDTRTDRKELVWHPMMTARSFESVNIGILSSYLLLSSPTIVPFKSLQAVRTSAFLLPTVLLLVWAVHTWLDLTPLTTFTLTPYTLLYLPPQLIWIRYGLLTLSAILIPLFQPRQYTPVDPENSGRPHPEQTSSIASFVTYTFIDPLMYKTWFSPTPLSYDSLPELVDTDASAVLKARHMASLDPVQRQAAGLPQRHLAKGLAVVFWRESVVAAGMLVVRAAMELISPVAMNQLLKYLQTKGEGAVVQPWAWILLLFAGPVGASLANQHYGFVSTKALMHVESLLSQLLFEHALRIKMTDGQASGGGGEERGASAAETPSIVVESAEDRFGSGETTVHENEETEPLLDPDTEPSAVGEGKNTASIAGRINTLMSADIDNIGETRDSFLLLVYAPVNLILGTWFLYSILSWSALVGMLTMIISIPIPVYLTRLLKRSQEAAMRATDSRVQVVMEALATLRMVKVFAWENKIEDNVAVKRDIELKCIWKRLVLSRLIGQINFLLPVLTLVVTFGLYTSVEGKVLNAATVFSSLTVFNIIRQQLRMLASQMMIMVGAKVSLDRFDDFLRDTELLDRSPSAGHIQGEHSEEDVDEFESGEICVRNAVFRWDSRVFPADAGAGRDFKLRIRDLTVPLGKLTIVTGPTGCGKSSLLMALLGEMSFQPSSLDSAFHLPRKCDIAYAAQDAWVVAATVRENVIFGAEYDQERYNKVIRQCALDKDLEMLDAGDQTELGERGITASGGQKARISLARAVYSDASILLLDDVLSALDVHTARHITSECLNGDLLSGRTVILVTHHVSLVRPIADYAISLYDGCVKSHGPVIRIASDPASYHAELGQLLTDQVSFGGHQDQIVTDRAQILSGKLVLQEEKAIGRVSRKALFRFCATAGGPLFWITFWFIIISGEVPYAYCNFWLGLWAKAFDGLSDPAAVSNMWYLSIWAVMMFVQISSYDSSTLLWTFGALKATNVYHKEMLHAILHAPLRFLDQTPTGRMVARFTKDMNAVDRSFIQLFRQFCALATTLSMKIVMLLILVPIFIPFGLIITLVGVTLAQIFIHGQLNVKREMSNAKGPMFSQFGSMIHGIVSIRAYGAEERIKGDLQSKADRVSRASNTFYHCNRWITLRIDFSGALFAASVAMCLFYGPVRTNAVMSGFILNQATSFAADILWFMQVTNNVELQSNSIERIHQYIHIPQEQPFRLSAQPPASWPTNDEIEIKRLTARYSEDGPVVLDNLSFDVPSGTRVGIVGRTGSGKSTLALALLRMIPTTGDIIIAGKDIDNVNLSALRSHITMIPQDPVLLAGSLRYNLDPFGEQENDAEMNECMRLSGLNSAKLVGGDGTRTPMDIHLDTEISSGGANLSQGQRQLVALARALVRRSRILILDEATASVDFVTVSLVQQAIRNLHDVTILTIAHRLSSIMDYDKVLVLGEGKLLEYDTPKALLQREAGFLKALVESSNDRKELERLAGL